MAADTQQTETAGAPGSETSAPSPSQEAPRSRRDRDAELAELRRIVAEQGARLAEQAAGIAALEQSLQRLADALGRADAILPTASPDQIRAAHAAGARLKVITAFSRGSLVLQAGRVIEARHYPVETLVDLARAGHLRVAVLTAQSKAA